MPRSIIRRKVEKSISVAAYKLKSIIKTSHFHQSLHSPRLEEFTTYKPAELEMLPQRLHQFDTRIGIFCEESYLESAILHMLPNSKCFKTLESFGFDLGANPELEGFLCILTNRSDFDRIAEAVSESIEAKIPVAVYFLDRATDQLRPVMGEIDSASIPLGIFPFEHNPSQGFPREKNTSGTGTPSKCCTLANRLMQRLRSNLPVEEKVISGIDESGPRQLRLPLTDSIQKYKDASIRRYLAQGIQLLANYSHALFNAYPSIDFIVEGVQARRENHCSLAWNRYIAAALISEVYDSGTIYDALARVLSTLTSQPNLSHPWKSRVLIVCDISPNDFKEEIAHQTNFDFDLCTSQQALALGQDAISQRFDYITRMSPDRIYPPDYLQSKLTVFKYTAAEFVSEPELSTGRPHLPITNATQPLGTVSSTSTKNCLEFFALASTRLLGNGVSDSGQGTEYFSNLMASLSNAPRPRPQLSVIVPVYNNGQYLVGKALPSLFRNDSWDSMEIILVDDGSTDLKTITLCRFLTRLFPNFRFFRFPEGGSGSASRARNMGIRLASCNALTFLDPDNEISDRGYDKLLRQFTTSNKGRRTCDFVSGYQVKVASTTSVNARHSFAPWPTKIKNPRPEFFESGFFPTVSTQAAIINRQILIENKIEFVPNAVGQDTLFGWQVLLAAKNPVFTNAAFLLYYSERSTSVTNSVNANYFRKCLRRETAQVKWLQENSLLDSYIANKLSYFIERWYEVKLAQVPKDQRQDAEKYFTQIVLLYENAKNS